MLPAVTREVLIEALNGTTVPENQKQAGEFLDKRSDSHRLRTVTSSSDNTDWQNLSVLLNAPDALQDSVHKETEEERRLRIRRLMYRWRFAARRALFYKNDPWAAFFEQDIPKQVARRYRYSAIRKNFVTDLVEVRLHPEAFASGAMRECFRMKKLSSISRTQDWKNAQNYVAKRYIKEVDRKTVFDDVRLQMDAKLWAEEFNRHNPPKKIDIMQMCVLEMINMENAPLYHLEHFIEGDYIKYNSNSGFVSEVSRKTPHAFSHFSFERSGHQLMIVDVQGVGDLYTDPQVHTVIGTDYGDGNLGTKGMALFFKSHMCNDICHMLLLTEFDLSDTERKELEDGVSAAQSINASTVFSCTSRMSEEAPVEEHKQRKISRIQDRMSMSDMNAMECLRERTRTFSMRSRSSSNSSMHSSLKDHDDDCICSDCLTQVTEGITKESMMEADESFDETEAVVPSIASSEIDVDQEQEEKPTARSQRPQRKVAFHSLHIEHHEPGVGRQRNDSMCSSGSFGSSRQTGETGETEKETYWNVIRKQSMPAGLVSAEEQSKLQGIISRDCQISILGQIHLDLARYHELGRFLPDREDIGAKIGKDLTEDNTYFGMNDTPLPYDRASALYHLDVSRRCHVLEAVVTVAHMVYGMSHELLKDVGDNENWQPDDCEDRESFAFDLMLEAAEAGDRSSMLFVAECFETGCRMGANAEPSYPKAIGWYQKLIGFDDPQDEHETTGGSAKPRYEILAKMAEMYQEGGCGLQQDFDRAYSLYTEAAEMAMEDMKGKLANKYYEKAEMCAV